MAPPIYAFTCEGCGPFDLQRPPGDAGAELDCPTCGRQARRRWTPAGSAGPRRRCGARWTARSAGAPDGFRLAPDGRSVRPLTASIIAHPVPPAAVLGLCFAGNLTALEQVNDGYRDLLAGKNIRGVIIHES
jgi:putative FmdB family regulatory protein